MNAAPATICRAASSQLVIIDVQTRLAAAMASETRTRLLHQADVLLQAARLLQVPVIYTEQYPKGLGHTEPTLLPLLEPDRRVEKTAFSCCDEPAFCRQLTRERPQLVLAGMEAHICVLQTALALQAAGWQPFVVADAVASRSPANRRNALQRLRQAGIIVSNTESVLFEWLGRAEGEVFKAITRLIR